MCVQIKKLVKITNARKKTSIDNGIIGGYQLRILKVENTDTEV